MSKRLVGATVGLAGLVLLAFGYFLFWPHRRQLPETGPAMSRTGSAEDKPSPLTATPVPTPQPGEHRVPPPALPPAEQTPQTLAAMIQSLATQPNQMVRVVNVKHDGGDGCHGTLVFTLDEFRFECPEKGSEPVRIARSEVGQVHKNGIQVWRPGKVGKLGRRYHFSMVGRSKDLVEDSFAQWMKLRPSA